jgi:hypothetical protein
MDAQLLCLLIEEAYREGLLGMLERCAVVVDGELRVGERSLREMQLMVQGERLECYTITAKSAHLTRLSEQARKRKA